MAMTVAVFDCQDEGVRTGLGSGPPPHGPPPADPPADR